MASDDKRFSGYEVINISADDVLQASEFVIKESPWITIHDGISGELYQYNRETHERREVPEDWWE